MAWLEPSAAFNPEALGTPIVGICSQLQDHDSGVHGHAMGQVLFTRSGCTRIELDQPAVLCLLPPTRAAWIPPGVVHRARMRQAVEYRSVYFAPALCERLPASAQVIALPPLLRELLEQISVSEFDMDWRIGRAHHLAALCLEELSIAPREPLSLPLPVDRRLSSLLGPQLPPPLRSLARRVGASERTLTRLMLRETGMSYQQWRQQWRLMRAVECLSVGDRLSDVALELGFTSDSTFIAFFRTMTGTTPRAYLR